MDTRGEKLQRARILLRELSSLDASNIENIDTNKLQELAKEYAILSNDSAIKDQFRRMEQNVSIPPVVMQLLERAKITPLPFLLMLPAFQTAPLPFMPKKCRFRSCVQNMTP